LIDKKQYPDRQAYKIKSTLASVADGSLKAQGIVDGTELVFKDLGAYMFFCFEYRPFLISWSVRLP
jgi:hypothetical protein